jgi:type VI secretion system protein ImpC
MRDSLRMLVIGDFSGRAFRNGVAPGDLAERPLVPVDLDRFDAALARIGPQIEIAAGGPLRSDTLIAIRSLDEFHPDRLFSRLDAFRNFRESRARLLNPATVEAEMAALMQPGPAAGAPSATAAQEAPAAVADSSAEMLERLLGSKPRGEAPVHEHADTARGVADRLARQLVAGHVSQRDSRAAEPYLAVVDALASECMRQVLHSPAFQATESAWRGVRWLVESLDLGDDLQIELLDASKAELAEDARRSRSDLAGSKLYRRLLGPESTGAGERPPSLLIGDFTFGPSEEDMGLLETFGALGTSMGASFFAAASPSLVGCKDLAFAPDPRQWSYDSRESQERWQALRSSRVAASIGLAMPRVLLRLPYGRETEAIESFAFTEMSGSDPHSEYLWGNPAFACALAIGRAFQSGEPDGAIGEHLELGDLPAHVVDRDGERQLQACAEYYLSASLAEAIQDRGVIPVLSYRNRNAVRIAGLASIASVATR